MSVVAENESDALNFLIHETQGALVSLNEALNQLGIATSGQSVDVQRIKDHLVRANEAAHFIDVAVTSAALFYRDDYVLCSATSEVRVFDCLQRNFKRLDIVARSQGKRISINGGSFRRASVFPCFQLLFYLFLDNAVKYGIKARPITVDVIELASSVKFRFTNLGPRLLPDERDQVTMTASRGEMATLVGKQGRGLGLSLAKHICEIHGFKMSVIPSERVVIEVGGIPYSDFIVEVDVDTL